MMVGDNEESGYEECAFVFFSPVEMPGEPATLMEALESSDADEWKNTMESELKRIEEKDTWEWVELPEGRKAITSKWLFKINSDADGKIQCYKSRLAAKGYQQKEKVDFKELFVLVVKPTMLRTAGATLPFAFGLLSVHTQAYCDYNKWYLSPLEQFRQWLDLQKGMSEVLMAMEKPKLKANPVIPPCLPCNQILANLKMSLWCLGLTTGLPIASAKLEPSLVKHVTTALGQRAEVNGMGKAMFKGADGKMVGLKNRQVAASFSTKGEAVGSGYGVNDGAKAQESTKCKPGGTSKQCELEESGAAAKEQHKGEENPKAAAEEENGESMWGTIARAAFSNPTSATGECDWLTLHRRMGHVALPILQQLFTHFPFSSSDATAKAPLDEVVMDVVVPLELGAAQAEYFLTIVDVYTRMTWVYVLSKKSDVAETLTNDAPGKRAKSALVGAALMVGDDEESDYEECAFAFFSLVEMTGEPATLKEALEGRDAEEWKKAMEIELKIIEENGMWELVELPEGRKAITSKWLFKIKSDADGKIERYKSRLEEIFMAQPEGFDDGSGRVCKLKKALYGLKQAPRQWYLKQREVLEEIGFTLSSADHSLFMLGKGGQRSLMVVYVDDILIFSPSSNLVKEVMLKLHDKFKCKALGEVKFYLGLHIERDVEKRCMRVHQQKNLEAFAINFGQIEGHLATRFPSGFVCVKGPEE
ncbi:unnamed protein product [Closterium sp. NIES-54]